MKKIDWSQQHCGIYQGTFHEMVQLMPDLKDLVSTFPENPLNFIWDVKVHMLMPGQYPCIPNWHYDNIPRDATGTQMFDKTDLSKPMYLWLSGGPYTEFSRNSDRTDTFFVEPETWYEFYQSDEHRGTKSEVFCWRGFIRATHKDISPPRKEKHSPLRRHCQVYLDADNFKW